LVGRIIGFLFFTKKTIHHFFDFQVETEIEVEKLSEMTQK